MIAIIDYNAGNIFSVKNALDYLGADCVLTSDAQTIKNADKLILPGVGAFGYAMQSLDAMNLTQLIKEQAKQKHFLGICLGMQMLFDKSFELGENDGLGLIKGKVDLIPQVEGQAPLIIPHMGWNRLDIRFESPLMQGITSDDYVYFVHSYRAFCGDENIVASSGYGTDIPACVTDGGYVYGCQFHPEKSGDVGMRILKNFSEMK